MEQRKQEEQKIMATFSHCFKMDYFVAIISSILIFGLVKAFPTPNELLQCAIAYTLYLLLELKIVLNRTNEKLVISDTQVQYFSGGWKWAMYTKSVPICVIDSCETSKNLLQSALGTSTLEIHAAGDMVIKFEYIQDGEKAASIINDMLK